MQKTAWLRGFLPKYLFGFPRMKSAGDFDTNAHPCRIGGADFLLFRVTLRGGVRSIEEGVQYIDELQIKPELTHFT